MREGREEHRKRGERGGASKPSRTSRLWEGLLDPRGIQPLHTCTFPTSLQPLSSGVTRTSSCSRRRRSASGSWQQLPGSCRAWRRTGTRSCRRSRTARHAPRPRCGVHNAVPLRAVTRHCFPTQIPCPRGVSFSFLFLARGGRLTVLYWRCQRTSRLTIPRIPRTPRQFQACLHVISSRAAPPFFPPPLDLLAPCKSDRQRGAGVKMQ